MAGVHRVEHATEIFRQVFRELGIPYLAADLARVRDGILTGPLSDRPSLDGHLAVPLDGIPEERRPALVAALAGLFRSIDVTEGLVAHFASSTPLREPEICREFLSAAGDGGGRFAIYELGDELVWEEETPWPLAYSTLFQQLITIVTVFRLALEGRKREIPAYGTLSSDYGRLLPTKFHYAAAALGAWLGGAANNQFFSHYATEPQVLESARNIKYATAVGYSAAEAEQLDESGLIVVPAGLFVPLLAAQDDQRVFGSIGINEFNLANPPKDLDTFAKPVDGRPALLVDKYYRAPFLGRKVNDDALYGSKDVLRDHYTDFYSEVDTSTLLRCKHYCAPVLTVSSVEEMAATVDRVPRRSEDGVFFRGQPALYTLQRDPAVRRMLFGDSCGVEPSLTTSAARRNEIYENLHFALRYHLSDRVFARAQASGDMEWVRRWRELLTRGDCGLDRAIMAVAQHYGLPSHGLDVTTDLEVAIWFATNVLEVGDGGRATYHSMAPGDWADDEDAWPVVFVHQVVTHSIGASLQDCEEIEGFGFQALRPSRQHARFFLGGHTDHQNRLAETVVCAFRLQPGDYATRHRAAALFPSPAEDEAYRMLLEFAEVHRPAEGAVLNFHAR